MQITRRNAVLGALGAMVANAAADPRQYCRLARTRLEERSAIPWAPGTKNPPDKDATAEMLLKLMHGSGVQRTVIIQVIHYKWDNRYVADVLKRYPQYFRGVARVNPEDPAAPDHLSKLTEEHGFHGVRISPAADASGDWIRGPLMPPLWKRCERSESADDGSGPGHANARCGEACDQFPDLTDRHRSHGGQPVEPAGGA